MKEHIDLLEQQVEETHSHPEIYPDLPMCIVAILPSDSANRDFHYQVPVEGIIENWEVTIQRGNKKTYNCQYIFHTNQIIIKSLGF